MNPGRCEPSRVRSSAGAVAAGLVAAALTVCGCTAPPAPAPTASASTDADVITLPPEDTNPPTVSASGINPFASSCKAVDLRLSVAGSSAGSGTTQVRLRLTNAGASRCAVVGFVSASVLSKTGSVLATATRDANLAPVGTGEPKLFVLTPGRTVSFLLSYGGRTVAACRAAKVATTVRILLPADLKPLTATLASVACQVRVGQIY